MVVIGLCRKWLERFRGQIGKQGNVQATETATSRDIELGEQQKIAACLGSLNDWIAAEDRKLAAHRRHKQGLMQQLFPSPEVV